MKKCGTILQLTLATVITIGLVLGTGSIKPPVQAQEPVQTQQTIQELIDTTDTQFLVDRPFDKTKMIRVELGVNEVWRFWFRNKRGGPRGFMDVFHKDAWHAVNFSWLHNTTRTMGWDSMECSGYRNPVRLFTWKGKLVIGYDATQLTCDNGKVVLYYDSTVVRFIQRQYYVKNGKIKPWTNARWREHRKSIIGL